MATAQEELLEDCFNEAAAELSCAFGMGNDTEAGREIIEKIGKDIQIREDVLLCDSLDILETLFFGQSRETKGEWTAISLMKEVMWRLSWLAERSKRIAEPGRKYSVEEALQTLYDNDCITSLIQTAATVELAHTMSAKTKKHFPTVEKNWLWKLCPELLRILGERFSLPQIDETCDAIDNAYTLNLGKYIEKVEHASMVSFMGLFKIICHHMEKEELKSKMLAVLNGWFASTVYDDIYDAVSAYLLIEKGHRDDGKICTAAVQALLDEGLEEEYRSIVSGVPIKDILI